MVFKIAFKIKKKKKEEEEEEEENSSNNVFPLRIAVFFQCLFVCLCVLMLNSLQKGGGGGGRKK